MESTRNILLVITNLKVLKNRPNRKTYWIRFLLSVDTFSQKNILINRDGIRKQYLIGYS